MSQNISTNPAALTAEDKRRILAEESAILSFTEEVLRRMEEVGMTKSDLASKLDVEPAAVSKLIGGTNNFTLKTMVRIARALRSRLKFSLSAIKPVSPTYHEELIVSRNVSASPRYYGGYEELGSYSADTHCTQIRVFADGPA
jgi:predicted transcriptional regulator